MELGEWEVRLRDDATIVPDMSALIAGDGRLPLTADPITIGLQELLWDEGPDQGVALARVLADGLN